jgi:cyclopropane-fatty-acyl-phospholipid synthase
MYSLSRGGPLCPPVGVNMKQIIQDLFNDAGITINGNKPWDITIRNDQFYKRLLTNTDLAIGESYMDRWWDASNLDQFFYRVFTANLQRKALMHPRFWRSALRQTFFEALRHFFNFQTKEKAKTVAERHYDIGNDLYTQMLDKRMVYTCAYWENAANLDEAQVQKLKLTCEKLGLKPGMKVLDIGCGWGSFVKYAAEHYGVTAVGVTISKAQVDLARENCAGLPIEIRLQDYRDLRNSTVKYDRIVSLGMFEHVGHKNYATYMKIMAHCLKDDGLFLLHTIGSNRFSTVTSRWINTYIFPHGQLPSIAAIGTSLEDVFVMEDWHNIGVHYDKTLMAWHQNFNENWSQIKKSNPSLDDRFRRMWNYYLLSSAANFRARQIQLWQIVLSKNGLNEGFKRPVM